MPCLVLLKPRIVPGITTIELLSQAVDLLLLNLVVDWTKLAITCQNKVGAYHGVRSRCT